MQGRRVNQPVREDKRMKRTGHGTLLLFTTTKNELFSINNCLKMTPRN